MKIGGTDYNIVGSQRTNDYANLKTVGAKANDVIEQDGVKYTLTADVTDLSAAAGIAVTDSAGNAMKLTVKEGATLTDKNTVGGGTVTLVGSAAIDVSTTTAHAAPTWAAGDKVVDKDGVEYTYVDVAKNPYQAV